MLSMERAVKHGPVVDIAGQTIDGALATVVRAASNAVAMRSGSGALSRRGRVLTTSIVTSTGKMSSVMIVIGQIDSFADRALVNEVILGERVAVTNNVFVVILVPIPLNSVLFVNANPIIFIMRVSGVSGIASTVWEAGDI